MNDKMRKAVAAALAIILVGALLASLILSIIPASAAPASSSLSGLRDKAKKLADEKKAIESELKQIKTDKASANKRKNALDRQVEVTAEEVENTENLILELSAEIAATEDQLVAAQEKESSQYELFKTRVRVMQETSEATYLGILLKSESFSDLLDRVQVINEIVSYDKKVMEELKSIRTTIADTKTSLESDKTEQAAVKVQLEARKADLKAQLSEILSFVKELEKEEAEYRKAFEEAEAEQEKVQQDINRMIAELAKKNTVYVGGVFTWPCPGHTTITSEYGMRFHPILKTNKMHTGTDISAPKNTNIVAANSGTVIISQYNSGYGNYVVIDHGGGVTTLYGHMTTALVSVNQKVEKGETIGKVGSTGYSTGNHLHFEVSVGGQRQNPMSYFTKG